MDYYKLLEVDQNSPAEEIKKSYKKLAMKYHPDKNLNDPTASAKFQNLAQAYNVLNDPKTRKIYDQYGKEGLEKHENMSNHSFNANNIFESLFRGGGGGLGGFFANTNLRRSKKTEKTETKVSLTLQEMVQGSEITVSFNQTVIRNKSTKQFWSSAAPICINCKGAGQRMDIQMVGPGMIMQKLTTCSECNGTGVQLPGSEWFWCTENVRKNIKLPPGIPSDRPIILENCGEVKYNKGNKKLDLYIYTERVENDQFKNWQIKGNDLIWNTTVNALEGIFVRYLCCEHPNGKNYTIKMKNLNDTMAVPNLGICPKKGRLLIQIKWDWDIECWKNTQFFGRFEKAVRLEWKRRLDSKKFKLGMPIDSENINDEGATYNLQDDEGPPECKVN
jgi:molecular chaperone DnaJ